MIRHDADPRDRDGFARPSEDHTDAFERFHALMVETGIRRGFAFPGPGRALLRGPPEKAVDYGGRIPKRRKMGRLLILGKVVGTSHIAGVGMGRSSARSGTLSTETKCYL